METKYLIDPAKFRGVAESTVTTREDGRETVDYSGALYNHNGPDLTLAEYNALKGTAFIVASWDEFESYLQPYLQSLQGPFEEISQDRYEDALEVLPPRRWTRKAGSPEFFFLGETFTYNLASLYVQWKGKYYTALRDMTTPAEKIISNFLQSINAN